MPVPKNYPGKVGMLPPICIFSRVSSCSAITYVVWISKHGTGKRRGKCLILAQLRDIGGRGVDNGTHQTPPTRGMCKFNPAFPFVPLLFRFIYFISLPI